MDKVTKSKIRKTLTKEVRYDHDGNELPKHVQYTQQKDRHGYMIWGHPAHPARIYFVKTSLTMDQRKAACLARLKELDDVTTVNKAASASQQNI
jgi:hypothetical protein